MLDGEVVALDEQGKPNFNLPQNFRSTEAHIMFYVFDDLIGTPLSKRREILSSAFKTNDHIGISQVSHQSAKDMLAFVKAHGSEGIIAKHSDIRRRI